MFSIKSVARACAEFLIKQDVPIALNFINGLISLKCGVRIKVNVSNGNFVHVVKEEKICLVSNNLSFNPLRLATLNYSLFFKQYQPKIGDTVIEIGAGSGTETQYISQQIGSTGIIYAFEPEAISRERLTETCRVLDLQNVFIQEQAVSDENGVQSFVTDGKGSLNSHLLSKQFREDIDQEENGHVTYVETINLWTFLEETKIKRVDFLKMNIEGAEFDALTGLKGKYKLIKNLVVSCHDFLNEDKFRTYEKVKALLLNEFENVIENYSTAQDRPWESYYLYAKNT